MPHYSRPISEPGPDQQVQAAARDDAMDDAAKALRLAEIESAQENAAANDPAQDEPARPRNAK